MGYAFIADVDRAIRGEEGLSVNPHPTTVP